jgi:glycosyltransferase involved in cell wall biosynthesis
VIRVLHIVPTLSGGGGEQVAIHLLRNMDRSWFEPMAISFFDRRGAEAERLLENEGITVTYLGKRLGFDPRMAWRIRETIKQRKPDVVHTHLTCLRYALPALVASRGSLTAVHTVHNLAQREVIRRDQLLYRFAFRRLGVTPVAIADAVHKSIQEVYRVTAPLIRNGIPVSQYQGTHEMRLKWREQHQIAPDEIVFVNVARLSPQKNQRLLLHALARVASRHRRLCCLLVGSGPLESELRQQAEALSLQNKVRFLGQREDVREILAASDVGVLSSDWEGNPLSVMEIMASGKPMIATAVGGVPELVLPGTGFLVSAGDVVAFADAMERLVCDPDLRARMGAAGTELAQRHFSASAMARQYEHLYEAQLRIRISSRGTAPWLAARRF